MKKILLVEDEKNIRLNLAEILELNNFTVTTAEDGQEALLLLEAEMPDLIISDILMPRMNGYELFEAISKRDKLKAIPFLFLSAKTEPEDIRKGMNMGADDYITKPVKHQDLIQAVHVRLQKKIDIAEMVLKERESDVREGLNVNKARLKQMLTMLSKAELKVLELLADNLSSNDIAAKLYLSFKTVQNHRANMAKKLGFSGQNTLLAFALECKMMDLLGKHPHLYPTDN